MKNRPIVSTSTTRQSYTSDFAPGLMVLTPGKSLWVHVAVCQIRAATMVSNWAYTILRCLRHWAHYAKKNNVRHARSPEVIPPVASWTTRRHCRNDPREDVGEDDGVGVVECATRKESSHRHSWLQAQRSRWSSDVWLPSCDRHKQTERQTDQ